MDKKISLIKERIIYIADYKNISYEKFFNEIGVAYSNFKGNQKKTSIKSDTLDIILSIHKEISPEWLLTGRGEMLRSESTDPLIDCKDLEQQLNTVKTELKAAYEENGALKYQLKEAKATIERLKNAGGNVYSE